MHVKNLNLWKALKSLYDSLLIIKVGGIYIYMKKKFLLGIITTISILTSVFSFGGCGNMDVFDTNYTLNYIIINEGGLLPIMHKVQSWSDSDSDSAMVKTKCCNNYIWTSSNNATLYEKLPDYLTEGLNYIKCSHIEDEQSTT